MSINLREMGIPYARGRTLTQTNAQELVQHTQVAAEEIARRISEFLEMDDDQIYAAADVLWKLYRDTNSEIGFNPPIPESDDMEVVFDSVDEAQRKLGDDYLRFLAVISRLAFIEVSKNALRVRAMEANAFRRAGDPKAIAMEEIRLEWEQRHRPGAAFAREMAAKYQQQGVEISQGGISNALARWRRQS